MSGYQRSLWAFLLVATAAIAVLASNSRMVEVGNGEGGPLAAHQDIDGFMRGYWNSSETTFAGASGISRGWQTVLDHYHKNYPNRATMGHLDFSEIEITSLGNDAALILGRWHLNRDAGPVGGIFTLVARRFPEGWRIIHDHTSTDAVK
jgi:SnoaL-like domain